MKKRLPAAFLFIFLINILPAQTVSEHYIDGRVYVKFTKTMLKSLSKENPKNLPLAKLDMLGKIIPKYGITKAHFPFHQANDDANLPYILKLEFSKTDQIDALIGELRTLPGLEYAEKVSLNKVDATTPNDFALSSASVHLTQINAQNAWDYFNGNSNITVAIVDNAVQWSHADLVGNVYTNALEFSGAPGVDDDGNGYIDDINGYSVADGNNNAQPTQPTIHYHGTLCAGVAAASTNNGSGISSIGWNLKMIPVQAEPDAGISSINVTYGYEGIIYAARAKAKIISCSWGSQGAYSHTEQYAIDYAWNRGSIIIASAGNLSSNVLHYPSAYNHVYCVAAVGPNDVAWSGSNFGTWVDISAPGMNIYSTMASAGPSAYLSFNGTSFAAPMVSGLAGLMLSKSPNMTRTDVLNCISSTAANIYTISGNSAYVSGSQLGAGRIDAFAAMVCAASYSALPPVANFNAVLPNTCPNTLILFKDSSLYQPTSWSWVFQGGNPATSSSSNPSVQWSTPGTYSVSLTVSNASGTDTKTKLTYINVAGPSPLPFSEGFQAPLFLPTGWTPNNLWNDSLYWQRVTGVGGYGTSTACAMFDNYVYNAPGDRDEMRTPKFDFSNVAKANLKFDVAYARYDAFNSDTLQVMISTNCGTTWTNLYLKGGSNLATSADQGAKFVPAANKWRTETIDLTPYAGQGNVMFSFLNRGGYGQPIYVDNINLAFPTPTLNTMNISSVCIVPTYTFSNISQASSSYTWNFQGGTPATSTATNPAVSYASPGTYTFSIQGINGTSTAVIVKSITVLAEPTIAASSVTYCAGNSFTLNSNTTGATAYTWSDASGVVGTNSLLVGTASASAFYTLVANNPACSSQGVFTLNVNPTPTLTANNHTVCQGNSATLSVSGAASYSWTAPSSSSESVVVTPANNTNYTVTGTTTNCSSSKTISVFVVPLPVAVGSSSNASCPACPDGTAEAIVSSGSTPYTYTWTPAGGNASLAAGLLPGCYTVTIEDTFGCKTETTTCVGFYVGLPVQSLTTGLTIFPNPSQNKFNVKFADTRFDFTVYNNLGQIVLSGNNIDGSTTLNLGEQAKGIYLVEVKSVSGSQRKKLILE